MIRSVLLGIFLASSLTYGHAAWESQFEQFLHEYTTQQHARCVDLYGLNQARLNLARHLLDAHAPFHDHVLATQLLHAVINSSDHKNHQGQAQLIMQEWPPH